MDIAEFKSGQLIQQYQYKSFSPSKINNEWTWRDPKINTLLAEANIKLGEINAFSLYVPNIDFFISMHVIKEATTSSRIEGTKTNIDEALLSIDEIDPEKRDDWQEVQNYIHSLNYSIAKLKELPVSTRLLKEAHKILLSGVRGETKQPGQYRTSQNWIGGATLKDAVFIPPHHSEVSDLMNDLENFIHNETIDVPHLIRIAIIHYQFETIHPFLDGNGRLGRLLITLYLVSAGLLDKPTLYLSDFFEKKKSLYYDNLTFVRTSDNLAQWIKFFLVAVIETSDKGIQTFKEILRLKDEIEGKKLLSLGNRIQNGKTIVSHLYRKPIINVKEVEKILDVTTKPANRIIQDFVEMGILEEITGYKRNRLFLFKDYYKLFADS
ncbi:MAG: Fic family protein [Melioribacteraceae bacterium]|nr:Fic family protein [Melioribacteraceae bacterium]